MALWKRGKRHRNLRILLRKRDSRNIGDRCFFCNNNRNTSHKEEPMQEETISRKSSGTEASQVAQEDLSGGVILYGEKVSGVFRKGFWGIFSIIILPPVLVFAFGILVIIGILFSRSWRSY